MKVLLELTDDQLAWVYRWQGKGITMKGAIEKIFPQLIGLQWRRKDKIITVEEET